MAGTRTQTGGSQVAFWRRLWVKLALFGILGVVITHAVHLVVANRISERALELELVERGRAITQLLARQVPDAILTNQHMAVQDLVDTVGAAHDVGYCFIHRGDTVLASSLHPGPTPLPLLRLRQGRGSVPLVVRSGGTRMLDLVQEVLHTGASVRVGMRLQMFQAVRRKLAMSLGGFALVVIVGAGVAAFLVGRRVARPVGRMVVTLQSMDPATPPPPPHPGGGDEIGLLSREVNRMQVRLHAAHLEQERARQQQVQTEKLAALGQLVAGVAHEINNPLAGLMSCRRRLLSEGLAEDRRLEYLELMGEGLERIEEVVGQLLGFARRRQPHKTRESLLGILRSTAGLLRPALESRRTAIEVDEAGAGELELLVDRGEIQQALVNLLLNAIYVTPAGAAVQLRVRRREGLVGIEVRDRGPGIPEEHRSHIEEPFFTTKPEGEGTGLGLSVARGIVAAHGGELSFEAPAGGGTSAILWLPGELPAEAGDQAAVGLNP